MSTNSSMKQFIQDGLVGVGVALLLLLGLAILFVGGVYFFGGPGGMTDLNAFLETTPDELNFINPIPYILMTAFVGGGVGGWILGKASSRVEWVIYIAVITFSMWIFGSVMAVPYMAFKYLPMGLLEVGGGFLLGALFVFTIIVPGSGVCALIGLVILAFLGALARPEKRFYRALIGSVIGLIVGFVAGFLMLISPFFGFA